MIEKNQNDNNTKKQRVLTREKNIHRKKTPIENEIITMNTHQSTRDSQHKEMKKRRLPHSKSQ